MRDRTATEGDAPVAGYLADALREPIPADAIRIVTVPAPSGAAEALLDRVGEPAVFWSVPGGPVQAGLGAAAVVTGEGPGRFEAVRTGATRLWDRVTTTAHPRAAPVEPRLFGGFAFLPGPVAPEWRDFGEARFVLPRLVYTDGRRGARLSMAISSAERERNGPRALEREAVALLDALGAAAKDGARPPPPTTSVPAADTESESDRRAAWGRAVASVQRRLAAGEGDKIVAARNRTLSLDAPTQLAPLLRRLARESAAARFAFRFGGAAFVGATPERLVGRTGPEVRTEALAGTVPAGDPEREARLLASLKDSVEHAYVVGAIVEALAPLCERLEYPDEPRIQPLRHVVHLHTPFAGRLRDPVHVLDLVERLHPTPAVGGWPTGPAVRWIEREEPGSRGWYAAPVGWFDDRGDGEFGVALRSGLLHHDRALLYAGAGIVRGSDPDAEFDETEVKLHTMLDALGIRS